MNVKKSLLKGMSALTAGKIYAIIAVYFKGCDKKQ